MPTKKPVSIGALLRAGTSPLARISRQSAEREQLADALRVAFPGEIKPHLVSAEVRNDRLVLVADNAVWAARMRFYASDVLKVMATIHTSVLERVEVRVRPPQPAA
jgi:hypothetical protein